MGAVRNIGLGVVGVIAVAAAIVAVRTATFKPSTAVDANAVRLAPSIPIDNAKAAERLGEAVRIATISHQDPTEDQLANWEALHQWLQTSYPAAHRAMTRTIVAERTLVYEWPGSDPSLAPIILMAHQDVVPVAKGAETQLAPSALLRRGRRGRGLGPRLGRRQGLADRLFEAVDALAAGGFAPSGRSMWSPARTRRSGAAARGRRRPG